MKPKPITFQRAAAENMPPVGTRVALTICKMELITGGYVRENTDGHGDVMSEIGSCDWKDVDYFGLIEWESEGEDE